VKTDELIERLVTDARPVRRLLDPVHRAALWAALALVSVTLGVLYFGLRRDALQMWYNAGLLVRLVLLAVTCWLAVITSFRLAVPGGELRAWSRWWPLVALGALVALSVGEVVTGAVTGTMGAPFRSWMCVRKLAFVGTLPALVAIVLIHRASPLEPRWTALLGVLAAGAAGALTSELACPIHAPIHILLWHILPIALFAGLGAVVGGLLSRRVEDLRSSPKRK
jgi:hypothetical protein